MPITTALLDIDGTLLDSNRLHAEAWAEALQKHGFHWTADDIEPLIGMGGDQLLPRLAGVEKNSDRGKKISDIRQKLFLEKYLPHVRPFPKARAFVEYLQRDLGLQIVVATSAAEEELNALLKQGGLEGLFEKMTNASDVEASKPAPDVIIAALDKASAQPAEAIMIGDTEFDLQAASRAGVAMIGLGFGHRTERDFPGALLFSPDLEDLMARIGPILKLVPH